MAKIHQSGLEHDPGVLRTERMMVEDQQLKPLDMILIVPLHSGAARLKGGVNRLNICDHNLPLQEFSPVFTQFEVAFNRVNLLFPGESGRSRKPSLQTCTRR